MILILPLLVRIQIDVCTVFLPIHACAFISFMLLLVQTRSAVIQRRLLFEEIWYGELPGIAMHVIWPRPYPWPEEVGTASCSEPYPTLTLNSLYGLIPTPKYYPNTQMTFNLWLTPVRSGRKRGYCHSLYHLLSHTLSPLPSPVIHRYLHGVD